MNRLAIVLFAFLAVSSAYRPMRHENAEGDERREYQPHFKHHEGNHGGHMRRGYHHGIHHHGAAPHHFMTSEIMSAIIQCKEKVQPEVDENGRPTANTLNCFVACVMEKTGEINENGKLNLKQIQADIETKAAMESKIASSCVAEIHAGDLSEACDTAGAYMKCFFRKMMELM